MSAGFTATVLRNEKQARFAELRCALLNKVGRTSLRAVAEEIGISHQGLRIIVEGCHPRPATLLKIREWYIAEVARRREVSAQTALVMLDILLDELPAPSRVPVLRRIVATLNEEHKRQRTLPPSWLVDVTESFPKTHSNHV